MAWDQIVIFKFVLNLLFLNYFFRKLGYADNSTRVNTPTLLPFFADMQVIDIAACTEFSAVVSSDHVLFLFGLIFVPKSAEDHDPFDSSLHVEKPCLPLRFDFFVRNNLKISQIVAKEHHLSILTTTSQIYVLMQYHTIVCLEPHFVPDVTKVLSDNDATIISFDGGPSIITSNRRGYGFSENAIFEAEFVKDVPIRKSITGKLDDHFAIVVLEDSTLKVIGDNDEFVKLFF